MGKLDWMISCDDHIVEPPNLWEDWIDPKFKDRAPRVVHENGSDFWVYEGGKQPMLGLLAAMGNPKEEWTPEPTTFDLMC
ncbi:MAG: hypothetical protein LOX97_10760 [Sphingomonas sp.]|nr:hypothetical protein [Sphingomonas sp.]